MVILNCYKEQSSATSHTPTTEGPGWKLTKPNVIKKISGGSNIDTMF